MRTLIYETHSLTVDNELGIATGWLPGSLSARGRREAVRLGERRADVEAVYASDLGRSVETVELAFERSGIPVHFDPRLRECNYGELNGAPVEELHRAEHVDAPFPGGESFRDVVVRTRGFLDDVSSDSSERCICVVAHSANLWALKHLLQGADLAELVNAPFAWQEGWEFRL